MTDWLATYALESSLWIGSPMPGLNEILEAAGTSHHALGGLKKRWAGIVKLHALQQDFNAISGPAHFEIECIEPNRRRDPDNVIGGALKCLFDALQRAELMTNDGWTHVLSILPTWRVDTKAPGVRLTVKIPAKVAA